MITNHSIRRAVTSVALAAGIGATAAAPALADPAGSAAGMHRLDTAAVVKIPSSLGVSDQNPCWSSNPNNPQLVFTQFSNSYNNGNAGGFSNTWVVNPDGTGATLLSGRSLHDAVNEPGSCWSSKNWIAWSGDQGGRLSTDEIVVSQPNGGHVHAVTGALVSQLSAWEPSFSPDGSWLVFESHPRCRRAVQPGCATGQDYSDQGVIYKVRFSPTGEGAQVTPLTCPGANQADQEPNWAPTTNTNLIVFQRNRVDAAGNVTSTDLYTMNPNDRNCHHIRNMTDNPAVDGVATSTTGHSSDASFSPDSSQIVYSGTTAGPIALNGKTCDTSNASIFLLDLNPDGSPGGPPQPVTCTTGGIYDGAPSYSPDGSTIAFESCDPHPTAANCPADDTRPHSYTRIWTIAAP